MKKDFFEAVAVLIGTIIGAGILSLPYVFAKAGFLNGLVMLLVIGLIMILVHLMLGEIVLRTKGLHQLPGYASVYLGKVAKEIMVILMAIGIYGALIAYLIGEAEVLNALFGLNKTLLMFIFFIFVSSIVYHGIKTTGRTELFGISTMILIILLLSILSIPFANPKNLTFNFNIKNLAIPYGAILFAMLGFAAVPEMRELLARDRKKMKEAIIIGTLIPIIIYFIFSIIGVAVIGFKGFQVTGKQVATVVLGIFTNKFILILGNLFAVFSMATSFLTLALALMETYMYDYKIPKIISWLLACVLPLIIALFGLTNFIQAISFAGTISGGLTGIMLVLIYLKSKQKPQRKPEYSLRIPKFVLIIITLIFILGLLSIF